jgi:hypothetical protein
MDGTVKQGQDSRLVVKIENSKPVELFDLTRSLFALTTQFEAFLQKNATSKDERETKLYVKEVKSGSIIVELMEFSGANILPFMENTNTIVVFTSFLIGRLSCLLKKNRDADLERKDYRALSDFVSLVAKDGNGAIHIDCRVNGDVINNYSLSSKQCDVIQACAKAACKPVLAEGDIHEKVLLRWFQTRSSLENKKGNVAIIESLSDKPASTIVNDDEVKKQMLHGDDNPLTTAYVVDVKIEFLGEKPVYRVLRLHETFEM